MTGKKRGHGEGTIFRRQDGRWVAELVLEDHKRKTFYGKTRKEAAEKLQQAIIDQKRGMLATGPQQTLEHFLNDWLENTHRLRIRQGTYVNYRGLIRNHVVPKLGHIPVQKLTTQQVQALYAEKLQEGLSPRTVRLIHGMLHKALDDGMNKWNLVSRNVCDKVTLPRVGQGEVQTLTAEQARQLLEVARGNRLEALIAMAVTTGMRRGELLSLRWQDVDLQAGSVYIHRTFNRLGKGFGDVENEPKTKKGRRKVLLPAFLIEMLNEHRERQKEVQLEAGASWQDKGLVFPNAMGNYIHPAGLRRSFRLLLKKAELPYIRFHDLRHSAATILLSKGVHPKVVQEILGHSDIGMTMNTYSHVLPTLQKEAMANMDELFRKDISMDRDKDKADTDRP